MIKGTNNLIYEFVSKDANEITTVANALHDALSGNRLYIHNKIILNWADDGFVIVRIIDVESCYNQLPKFLESGIEFNKFVKTVIDESCENVPVIKYKCIETIDKLREENKELLKKNRELSAKATIAADERDHKDILCKEYSEMINDLQSQVRALEEEILKLKEQREKLKKQRDFFADYADLS